MRLPETEARPSRMQRGHQYLRPPEPVYFPDSEEVPETRHHLECRTALFLILKHALAAIATVGSEQFVYWDPTTAKKMLAPDAFVRLGVPDHVFRTWKTWKGGAPDVAVEIVSHSDEPEPDWNDKLERYRACGIREVVRFDAEDRENPIRIWDAVSGDLVERDPKQDPDSCASEALGAWWVVVDEPKVGRMLRLSRDRDGRELWPLPEEAARAEKERVEAAARTEKERLEGELAALKAKLAATTRKRSKKR
jgi:hypothetical protein